MNLRAEENERWARGRTLRPGDGHRFLRQSQAMAAVSTARGGGSGGRGVQRSFEKLPLVLGAAPGVSAM